MSQLQQPPDPGAERALQPFLPEGWETVRALAAGVEALGLEHPGAALETLAVLAHRLYGSSSLYGLDGVAALAGGIERAVGAIGRGGDGAIESGRPLLREAVAALREGLAAAGRSGPAAAVPDRADLLARLDALGREAPADGLPGTGGTAPEPAPPGGSATVSKTAELRRFAAAQPDVLEFFAPEARDQVEGMAAALAALAGGGEPRAAVESLFRLAHTLKGAAYMVECEPIGDLAHALEDLLVPAREGRLALEGPALRALDDAVDLLQRMVAVLGGAALELDAPLAGVQGRLERLVREAPAAAPVPAAEAAPEPDLRSPEPVAPEPPPAETPEAARGPERTIRVGLDRIDRLMGLVGEAIVSRGRLELQLEELRRIGRQLAVTRGRLARAAEEIEPPRLAPRAGTTAAEPAGPRAAARLAVPLGDFSELELDRYDRLDLLHRQLAEISFDLGESQSELGAFERALSTETARSAKLLRDLRGAVGRTRMLRLEPLFQRFRRRVDRHARDAGAQVRLELEGGHVEVDTAVVERIADPLLHLVANALVHGVEGPAERLAAGKPETATIALRARLRGVFVDLEIEDDGRGLDAGGLRRRAVALGLHSADGAARLSDAEAHELIFVPGLSTATAVTGDAGRGVGMDAVRAAVADLNGQVRIETLPGRGTRFTLRLPVTLVVSTVLALAAGGERMAVPTLNVRRLLQVGPERLEREGGREWTWLDGERIEVIRPAWAAAARRGPQPLVVIQTPGRPLALAADELLGIEEAVVQGLGGFLAGLPGFGGVTVSADGTVVPVIDPGGIPALAAAAAGAAATAATEAPAREAAGAPILLVDDSISVRKVLGRQLAAAGWEVVTVADGEQALEALRDRRFAALVTDIEMPRLNGFELLDAVRRRHETRHLPAIVITTRAGTKHRELAGRLGIAAYLGKPVDLGALLDLLATVTRRSGRPGMEAS